MTITQMRYFKTVCQYMSLTKASRELHVSQPALSMAIKEIENTYGLALFHHNANSLAITEVGTVLLQEVSTIIDLYDHLEIMLSDHILEKNYVRVGFVSMNGKNAILTMISEFRRLHPEIQLFLTEDSTQELYKALDCGKVDLISAEKKPEVSQKEWNDSSLYRHKKLEKIQMSFAVSAMHPIAKRTFVSWQDISKLPLVLPDKFNQLSKTVQRELEASQCSMPKEVYYTTQISTVEQFIENNVACGFLPTEIIEDNPCICALPCPPIMDDWLYLVYRKDQHMTLPIRQFIQTAVDSFVLNKSA